LPVEELHGNEGATVLFADVVDGADIGMIQGGGCFGFTTEAFEGLAIASGFFGEEFEGDEAVEASVFGFEDDAHAATT
jgi:hypothetical protein